MKTLSGPLFIIVLTGFLSQATAFAQPGTYRNEAGPIRYRADEGVSGSFRLKKDPGGTWSTGTGGGCLVADFSASLGDSRCVTHDDCNDYLGRFLADLPTGSSAEGAHGYCARPGDTSEPRRCWIRPGPQAAYCLVSPLAPLPLNQPVQIPPAPMKGVAAFPLADGRKVRWMVFTCLNGLDFSHPDSPKDRPGCRESDANLSTSQGGKAKTLTP